MPPKGVLKSIIEVTFSNFFTIISGVVIGFLLPQLLTVEDYGYYKTFTLYVTYVGVFSFGIIDGIVLIFGGKNYKQFDGRKFRSYFKWYVLVHAASSMILLLISIVFLEGEAKFIFSLLSIFLIANNITGYFQQVSQITQRFKEYSARKILQSTLNIIIVLFLYILCLKGLEVNYRMYVVLWVFINVMLTLWYIKTYKDIVFGKALSLSETYSDIVGLVLQGFPLLIANLCSTLILTLDRQFVNIFFDTKTYGIYAFAYNLFSLITVATTAVSTVLYPAMKRNNKDELIRTYDTLIAVLLVFVYGALSVYFLLVPLINVILPKYTDSIVVFRIIFPGLSISSAITVIMHNYYKVFGASFLYFKKSIVVLVVSVVCNYLAYSLFKTTVAISVASIMTMVFWYCYVENYFVKNFRYRRGKNLTYLLLMTLVFYVCSDITVRWQGLLVYFIFFILLTLSAYSHKLKEILIFIQQ